MSFLRYIRSPVMRWTVLLKRAMLLLLFVSFAIAWFSPSIFEPRYIYTFAEMKIQLHGVENVASECFANGGVLMPDCNDVMIKSFPDTSPGKVFSVLPQGALLSVDYDQKIVIVVEPLIKDGELNWRCTAFVRQRQRYCEL